MPTERPTAPADRWRRILRVCRAGRRAGGELGRRGVAQAVVYELAGADTMLVITAESVLASLSAKGELSEGIDIGELDRLLQRHQIATQEIALRGARGPARRQRQHHADVGDGVHRDHGHRHERPNPLRVDEAQAVPILDLLERLGFRLRRIGREHVTCCPFHDDRRPSLQVNPAKGLWHCFPCGIGGDGIAFVERLRGCTFADAVREVAGC